MTTNHPAHGPLSLNRLHQIHEILRKAAAQSDGGNLGYAMADAVKVIDGAIASFGAEDLPKVCAEAYQVVGVMAEALGVFDNESVQKCLDNLSQRKIIHNDVLPLSLPCSNSPATPDDWVMVPITPTPEIASVIHKIGFRCNCRYCQERHWNELLDAAQGTKNA